MDTKDTNTPGAETRTPEAKPPEEFPERLDCRQCRRPYRVDQLRPRANTLLTETQLTCPQCRQRLSKMRLKDWYDHYIQGQEPDPVSDDDMLVRPIRRR